MTEFLELVVAGEIVGRQLSCQSMAWLDRTIMEQANDDRLFERTFMQDT
jgi:hypothetical protein